MADAIADTIPTQRSRRRERARRRRQHRDLRVLARFTAVYCHDRHQHVERSPVVLKTHDVPTIYGKELRLCEECRKLLAHSFVKRALCPLDPKPACKQCPAHCYAPKYRARIRDVMKYSGRKLVLRGRLDYLFRLVS